MKQHTKLYLKEMGYSTADFIPCEICHRKATDIHHIKARGMGGTTKKDHIDNLVALCRKCHETFGDKKQYYPLFDRIIHLRKSKNRELLNP